MKNNLVKVVMVICLLIMMSECEHTGTFVLSHLISLGIFILGGIYLTQEND